MPFVFRYYLVPSERSQKDSLHSFRSNNAFQAEYHLLLCLLRVLHPIRRPQLHRIHTLLITLPLLKF
jgi:hypothetical protein